MEYNLKDLRQSALTFFYITHDVTDDGDILDSKKILKLDLMMMMQHQFIN